MKIYDIYVNFYYALDYIFDLTNSTELGDYLSGANPFLFEGANSADPAIYDEFEKAYIKDFGTNDISSEKAYNWLKKYVNSLENTAVKNTFQDITLKMWNDAIN